MTPEIYPGLPITSNSTIANDLLKQCCIVCKVSEKQIISKSRITKTVTARQIFCFIAREKYNITYKEIGFTINRTHANVIHSVKIIQNYLDTKDKTVTKLLTLLM